MLVIQGQSPPPLSSTTILHYCVILGTTTTVTVTVSTYIKDYVTSQSCGLGLVSWFKALNDTSVINNSVSYTGTK